MANRKFNHQWERVRGTKQEPKYKVPNAKFAQTDKVFIEACKRGEVEPTTRQASKWRNKKGSAWLKRNS